MSNARFRLYLAVSADGYIATADGGVDWLDPFERDDYGFEDFLNGITAVVIGRKTYEQIGKMGIWPYKDKRAYVLSTGPLDVSRGKAHLAHDAEKLANRLQLIDGDVWVVGGAQTIRTFLDFKLFHALDLFVMPVILGGGIPMISGEQLNERLTLEKSQAFPSGTVKLSYRFLSAPRV